MKINKIKVYLPTILNSNFKTNTTIFNCGGNDEHIKTNILSGYSLWNTYERILQNLKNKEEGKAKAKKL